MNDPVVDFTLEVECHHRGKDVAAPPEMVARLAHRARPNGEPGSTRHGFLAWIDAAGSQALQTYFGEARRLGRSGLTHAPVDLVPGMDYGHRYRFECQTCGETVPVNARKLDPILETLRVHGVARVTLAGIADRL